MINHVATSHMFHHHTTIWTWPETWSQGKAPDSFLNMRIRTITPPALLRASALLLDDVPTTVAITPWCAANFASTMSCTTLFARHGTGRLPFSSRHHSRTISHRTHYATCTSGFSQFLVVNILSCAHGTTNHDLGDGCVVIRTTSTPPYASKYTTVAKRMIAEFVPQTPWRVVLTVRFKTEVTLPPVCNHLLSNGGCCI